MGPWDTVFQICKLLHKPSSPYALQRFSNIVQFVIADSKKQQRRVKEFLRPGGVSCILYTITAFLWDIRTKPVAGGLKEVKKASFRPL